MTRKCHNHRPHTNLWHHEVETQNINTHATVRTQLISFSSQRDCLFSTLTGMPRSLSLVRVSKGAKIRNRYNQIPHLTQDTNGKVTNSQLYTTHESQEVSPFPAGDHKAQISRHKGITNTRQKKPHQRSTKGAVCPFKRPTNLSFSSIL